jgi:hypothetical protein
MGGKFLPRLNISRKPIAHKYREGNVKSTLKRELKVFETAMVKQWDLLVHVVCYAGTNVHKDCIELWSSGLSCGPWWQTCRV